MSQEGGALQGPVRFSMTRQSVIIMASCILLSGLLSLILGFALGLRQLGTNEPAPTPISISATPASTAAQQ
jgi:hypothetical protein